MDIDSLINLRKELIKCNVCEKMVIARKEVMGDNNYPISFKFNSRNKIMLIGIAPGRLKFDRSEVNSDDEYAFRMGSGKILAKVFNDLNIPLDYFYITNIIKCITPRDNVFKDEDVSRCVSSFLKKEIDYINPKIVIVLGRKAENYFKMFLSEKTYHFMFHPSAVLRGSITYIQYLNNFKNLIRSIVSNENSKYLR